MRHSGADRPVVEPSKDRPLRECYGRFDCPAGHIKPPHAAFCGPLQSDIDIDGDVDYDDINPFIDLVQGTNAAAARTYDWDCENRLIRVQPTPGTEREGLFKVEFAYDYLGRRIEKQVWTYGEAGWGTPTVRRFVYHGWRMLLEMDGGMGVPPVNFVVRKYTWGLDLAGLNGSVNSVGAAGGVGGLLAMQDPNDPNDPNDPFGDFVYLYDAAGNVGQLVDWSHDPNDPNGAIVAKYEYDPYGNIIAQSGSYADENPLRYSTKYYDAETGLSDYGHRYYHAGLGRWLSRDPIGELGGANLYGFVGNSPVNYVDYLGYMWVDCPYGICRGDQGDCPGRPGGSTPRYSDRDGHAGGGGSGKWGGWGEGGSGGGHGFYDPPPVPWEWLEWLLQQPPHVQWQIIREMEGMRWTMPPWYWVWLDGLIQMHRAGSAGLRPPLPVTGGGDPHSNTPVHGLVREHVWRLVHSDETLEHMSDARVYSESIGVSVVAGTAAGLGLVAGVDALVAAVGRTGTTYEMITVRSTLGADGGTSMIVKTVEAATGRTLRVVHRVLDAAGNIIHEDIKFILHR